MVTIAENRALNRRRDLTRQVDRARGQLREMNPLAGKLGVGFLQRKRGGTARRFLRRLGQFEVTRDALLTIIRDFHALFPAFDSRPRAKLLSKLTVP
jgi:hypothetical protein